MVGFKNRYMVMEVFLDPNKDVAADEPIILTQLNVSKAITDSILSNFGECGLASSIHSFQVKYVNPVSKLCIIRASRDEHQKVWAAISMVKRIGNCPVTFNLLNLSGSIRACKSAALKCDQMKFEQRKLVGGAKIRDDVHQQMQNCLDKIKVLKH